MIPLSAVSLFVLGSFAALMLAAAATDALTLTIPNRITLAVVGLYPAFVLTSPVAVDWLSAVGVGGAALAVGFALFATGKFGGGDAKLIAAVALWAGTDLIMPFLVVTSLSGGLIALYLMARAPVLRTASRFSQTAALAVSEAPSPLPYGLAIGVGGVYVALARLLGG